MKNWPTCPDGIRVVATHALAVPGLDAQRHLIVMERAAGESHAAHGLQAATAR